MWHIPGLHTQTVCVGIYPTTEPVEYILSVCIPGQSIHGPGLHTVCVFVEYCLVYHKSYEFKELRVGTLCLNRSFEHEVRGPAVEWLE